MISLTLASFWDKVTSMVTGFFAFIPQVIYFLYTSMGSLLDLCQLLLRKLAGLDVYYIKDVDTGEYISQSGDILREFIEGALGINNSYSALSTVFWSLIIFGVIVLVLTTILSIIKAHYNYDSEKSHPMTIIKGSLKSLALMAMTPLIVLFGVYLSEIILQTLDKITNVSSSIQLDTIYEQDAINRIKKVEVDRNGASVSSNEDGSYTTYYNSYDIFGVKEWTNTTTFSGKIFEIATYDANRVRNGSYTAPTSETDKNWDNCGIFYSTKQGDIQDIVASQVDYAFVNSLTLTSSKRVSFTGKDEASIVIGSTFTYGPSALFASGLDNVEFFSKFNVGLVWYYYNLWNFNFIVGFAAVIACLLLIFGILFGLLKRLIICVVLFLVQAPVIGISPLDGGNGFGQWKSKFMSYLFAAYGAIVGTNIFFFLLPFLESISFFNIFLIDKLFNMVIIIAGLTMISSFVSMVSGFVGGANLEKEGKDLRKGMASVATKGISATVKTAKLGVAVGRYALKGGLVGALIRKSGIGKKVSNVANKVGKGVKNVANKVGDKLMENKVINKTVGVAKKGAGAVKKGIVKGGGLAKSAVLRAANSPLGRMVLTYAGLNKKDIFTGSKKYKEQLENELVVKTDEQGNEVKDENGETVFVPKYSPEEVKQLVNERKEQGGMEVLNGAKDILKDRISNFGDILLKNTGAKKVIEDLVKAGITDDLKMAGQSVSKMVGVNPSDLKVGGKSILQTSEQEKVEKEHKKELKKAEVDEAVSNTNRATYEIARLIGELRSKR